MAIKREAEDLRLSEWSEKKDHWMRTSIRQDPDRNYDKAIPTKAVIIIDLTNFG